MSVRYVLHPTPQPLTQVRPILGVLEREVHGGTQETTRIAQVVTSTPVHDHVHGVSLGDQQRDGVGELQLAAARPA